MKWLQKSYSCIAETIVFSTYLHCKVTNVFLKTKKKLKNRKNGNRRGYCIFAGMNTSLLTEIIPYDFSPDSRVWVYQSNRAFIEKEQIEINEQLFQFYSQWAAHGAPVKGWAKIVYGQFIVIMADESATTVSGCSTDASVRVIKSIERQYDVNLFDRTSITFLRKDKAEMLPMHQIQYALDKGFITADTPVFNNVVYTKQELLDLWLVPIRNSWLAQRFLLPE